MTLRVIKHYLPGMPQTARGSRARQKAKAAHTTEGNPGEKGAWDTISWMHATAALRNASYNEFWAVDEAKQELLVIEVVPDTSAAHSIAPQPFNAEGLPLYQPDSMVKAVLGSTVNDPNMWVYAISIAGRIADANRYAKHAWFRAAARQRLDQLTKRGIGDYLLEHFRFNPRTRTDWGRELTPALTGKEESEMKFTNPIVIQEWMTKPGAKFTRPDGSVGEFTAAVRVTSIAEGTLNGQNVRLLCFGDKHEALVIDRFGMDPIAGTRKVGIEALGGTVEVIKEVVKEVPVADPKAIDTAVTAERTRIRKVLGI